MKRILVGLLLCASFSVFGQSAIVRGEVSAGNYETIATDGAQALKVYVVGTSPGTINNAAYTTTTPTVTNSSTTLLASNTSRKFLTIQNNDASGIVYVNFGAAATTAHLKIMPGGSLFINSAAPSNDVRAIGSIASNANVVVISGQ